MHRSSDPFNETFVTLQISSYMFRLQRNLKVFELNICSAFFKCFRNAIQSIVVVTLLMPLLSHCKYLHICFDCSAILKYLNQIFAVHFSIVLENLLNIQTSS